MVSALPRGLSYALFQSFAIATAIATYSRGNRMGVMTGLSGNEMYCMHLKGYTPGGMVIGNSVYSMGFVGGIGAGLRSA